MSGEKVINDVLIVGDENVLRDLHYPKLVASNGLEVIRAYVAPGGGKSGNTMARRLCGFEQEGVASSHFNAAMATSAGAYNAVAYAAGQTSLVQEVYQDISWLNPAVMRSVLWHCDYFGLFYLRDHLRERLDVSALKACPTDITIAVADMKGNPILHKAKLVDDVFDLLLAASAIIPLYAQNINGVTCMDGAYSVRSTVASWIRQLTHGMRRNQPVDLLYIANRPHPRHEDPFEEWCFRWFVHSTLAAFPELLQGALSIQPKLHKVAKVFERQYLVKEKRPFRRVRMCAIFPQIDENIYPNEWRSNVLKRRGDLTQARTEAMLRELRPRREI